MKALFFSLALTMALVLGACASAPSAKKEGATLTAADSAAIVAAVLSKAAVSEEPKLPQNIDAAHESFIRAMEMELRGEKALANVFWQHAAESDPYNRFLAFKLVEILMSQGRDSIALVQAERAQQLKGDATASQLGQLAHLYAKAGMADSCRKYFVAALDSSRYQDMALLYDYSLFLEAVQDGKELVRIYDLLLPQLNYMPTLFQRQLKLLIDQGKDSAVVELFAKGHEATGDKKMLLQAVQGLLFQQRLKEVEAIVDTLTSSTEDDEDIIVLFISALDKMEDGYKVLKKKYYEDHVQTPVLANYLGLYEGSFNNLDSAKVLLKYAAENMENQWARVFKAYHALSTIAIKEDKNQEAVVYAEKADSVAQGGKKVMLALTYSMAGMYTRSHQILDSLMGAWDNWVPLAGIADSASTQKMAADIDVKRRQLRLAYARVLGDEAFDLEQKDVADSVNKRKALELRTRAHGFYTAFVALDSTDWSIKMLMATNLQRMARYEESFKIFEELLDSAKESPVDRSEVLNYYGYTLIDLNRTPEEVSKGFNMVQMALALGDSLNPDEAYLDSKAWGLYRLGKFDEALKVLQQIKSPRLEEDYIYWEHLAAIQEALGLLKDAKESYKKLRKLQPHHSAVKRFFKEKK